MDILLNGDKVDALSFIVHKDFAYERGKALVEKLKRLYHVNNLKYLYKQLLAKKIVARTNIKSMGKNVLSKCYGGDISRKRKLLENKKQVRLK